MYHYSAVIIGAGPSGLATLRHLRRYHIPALAIEKRHDVGGVWLYEEGSHRHSSAYKTLVTITSKSRSAFSDFPFPPEAPDYLPYTEVQKYFRRYAEHFGLLEHIRFGEEVQAVRRENTHWVIQTNKNTYEASHLIVASGHHWKPFLPTYPGTFTGESYHSHDYTDPYQLKGRRLLIVGAGNSGADIAVDGVRFAQSVDLSIRRGYHILPKFGFFGEATDALYHKLLSPMPLKLRHYLAGLTVRFLTGSPTRYGMPKPDHPIFYTHPLVNSELLYHIRHGKVRLRPGIHHLDGQKVYFTDGTYGEYDTLIWATGYEMAFPFLPAHLAPTENRLTRLYLHIFHLDEPTLTFVGLIQPNGCLWNLSELQGQLIAHFILGSYRLPMHAEAEAARYWQEHQRRYAHSPRHLLEVDWHEYYRLLRKLIRQSQPRLAYA
jgi:cation diffusion facilitator CzcD-associated flavoprotein CzcO